jgi:non-specific serine/threonine protein kinase
VGWSYDLLSEPERRVFSCLGVFVGQVTLDAMAAVVQAVGQESRTVVGGERGSGEERRILQRLAALAENSLVLPMRRDDGEGDDPEPAFRMLETVREYAWEQLVAAGELAAARFAHAHYFLALAERAEPQLRERDQRAWFVRLEREQDNLRAALRWLLDQDDPAERAAGLRLAGSLGWFWFVRGYHAEGVRWLGEALTHAPADASAARTRVLLHRGLFFTYQGDLERARTALEEALALADQRHDPADTAEALTNLGIQALFAGDPAASVRLGREALARWEDVGNDADAIVLLLDALKRFEAVQDLRQAGFVRFTLAATVARFGDLPRAVDYVRAGLEAGLALQDRWLLSAGAHAALAIVGERADSAPGAQLLGAADALSRAMGAMLGWERMPHWTSVVRLREQIERGERGAAYRAGRSLSFGEVAALALRLLEEIAQALPQRDAVPESVLPPPHPSQPPDPLSAREREVLRLVAQGRSSKAIGQQLFLSPSTVNQHLTSVFHKLGVSTRAQAVAVSAQRGFL